MFGMLCFCLAHIIYRYGMGFCVPTGVQAWHPELHELKLTLNTIDMSFIETSSFDKTSYLILADLLRVRLPCFVQ